MPKAARTLPPAEYLRQCFDYDPVSGELRWRHRPSEHFANDARARAWNGRYPGRIVGILNPKGYLHVVLNDRTVYVSRIIFKMLHGVEAEWVDHKDRNRANNSSFNLRDSTLSQNLHNTKSRIGKSGYPGVYCPKQGKPFRAMIRDGSGKKRHLGSFQTAEEAHAAYVAAANEIFGQYSKFANHQPSTGKPESKTITD